MLRAISDVTKTGGSGFLCVTEVCGDIPRDDELSVLLVQGRGTDFGTLPCTSLKLQAAHCPVLVLGIVSV